MIGLSACAYDASFSDCTISCTATSGCPSGMSCGDQGLCRLPKATETCTAQFSSCIGLAATCGPNGDDDCCSTAIPIPGGAFYRSYDVAADGMYPNMSYPATVSPFVLDKYEVTVGRFRKFVDAGMGTQSTAPSAGAGAHVQIPNSGWSASDNDNLVATTTDLIAAVQCSSTYQTWTDLPGSNEELPITCITWYEAFAFCIWDGGYLPTETEWNYTASGGSEQRAYPWSIPASSTTAGCTNANYGINNPSGTYCVNGTTGAANRVGSESPTGDAKFGQSDLGGNMFEWVLDWFASYVNPCNDCANLTTATDRVLRGGSFANSANDMRTGFRDVSAPAGRYYTFGARCARTP